MPSIQEIERFKQVLNRLGGEPEILAARAEEIEDVPLPEEGLSQDLSELLDFAAPGEPGGGASSEAGLDFSSLFESGEPDGGAPAGDGPAADARGADVPDAEAPGLDLPDLDARDEQAFGGDFPAEGLDDIGQLGFPAAPPGPAVEAPGEAGETGEAVSPAELEGLMKAIGGEEPDGEEAGGEPGAFPGEAGEAVEASLPEEFDLPEDFQLLEPGPGQEEPAGPVPEGETDTWTLEGLEEPVEGFEETAAAGEEPAEGFEEPADDSGTFELPAEFRLEPEEPGFELPDLELPGGEEAGAGPADEGLPAPEEAGWEEAGAPQVEGGAGAGGPAGFEELVDFDFAGGEELPGGAAAGAPFEDFLPEGEVPADGMPGGGASGGEAPGGETPGGEAPGGETPREEIVMDDEEGLPAGGIGGDDFQIDEFVLPDVGEQFGLEEPVPAKAAPGAGAPSAGEEPVEEFAGAAEEVELSDEDFAAVRRSLAVLPRNLKIAVEELIGVKELAGPGLRALLDLLVAGAPPAEVAGQVSAITGKKIVLPAAFLKQSGLAFEAERGTFGYAFRQNILPLLRAFVLAALALVVLGYTGYRFVYSPLRAQSIYRHGYGQLKAENFEAANRSFDRATGIRPFKGWFFRYAEGFVEARQLGLAEQKYEQLLERYPGDRQGLLDFAGFESRLNGNYARADGLLDQLLEADLKDPAALLLKGDNYLAWSDLRRGGPGAEGGKLPSGAAGASSPGGARWEQTLEQAHRSYALYMDYHGQNDAVLFRMLRYFVRADKLQEALDLRAALERQPRLKVDAEAYTELGGYLLDRHRDDEAGETLRRALESDGRWPPAHYQMARYLGRLQKPLEEKKALEQTISLMKAARPWDRARWEVELIDAYDRLGRWYWNGREYLKAEEQYTTAVDMIRSGQETGRLGLNRVFGEAFHNLGDIYYYVDRGWEMALELYREAERNGFRSAAMSYKMGYAEYAGGQFDQALLEFSKVAEEQPESPNVLFALGNTLFLGKHYFSAEGHYLHLLSMLEGRRGRTPNLRPDVNPEHRALVENTMQVYNNLGVTLGRLAEQSRDPAKESQALAYLTFSSEFFDVLSRDPETMVRSDTRNLAFLNQRGMLYPQKEFELQIYRQIPMDLQEERFRE